MRFNRKKEKERRVGRGIKRDTYIEQVGNCKPKRERESTTMEKRRSNADSERKNGLGTSVFAGQ